MEQRGYRWEGAETGLEWRSWADGPARMDRRTLIHPLFHQLAPPLIVIGMHRSGTSLAAAMLAAMGVFMGPETRLVVAEPEGGIDEAQMLNGYAEASAFRHLNERLLSRTGARWDRVEPFLERRDGLRFSEGCIRRLQTATFVGLLSRFFRALPGDFQGRWGWKDPRNSLTLAYWLRLFPQARILHVRRDPEAVADSLHQRALTWNRCPGRPLPWGRRARQWALHPAETLRRAGRRFGVAPEGDGADPCLDREYCRLLSRQYVRECLRFAECGGEYREVRYEAILADPTAAADELAEFAGLAASRAAVARAGRIARPRAGCGRERCDQRGRAG